MASRKTTKTSKKSGKGADVSNRAAPVADENLLFSGLHFFFFPSSRTNRARALRIDKAIQHGATVSQHLDTNVSHIIMDDGMQWDQFTKHHKASDILNKDVISVNGKYIADCLAYGLRLDHKQRGYQVPGRFPDVTESSKMKRIASEPSLKNQKVMKPEPELQRANTDVDAVRNQPGAPESQDFNSIVSTIGRPIAPQPKAREPAPEQHVTEKPAAQEAVYEDDLTAMINEARATAHLPVESLLGEDRPASNPVDDLPQIASTNIPSMSVKAASSARTSSAPSSSDPMIMQRPSDGAWVKLRCKECGESNFESIKDFIKHCAFKHKQRFKTQDDAIEQWGFPLKSYTPPQAPSRPESPVADDLVSELEKTSPVRAPSEKETQERPAKRAKRSFEEKFACMNRGDKETKAENPNAFVIDRLQEMADHYERTGDKWRRLSFRKGVSALKNQSKQITTKEEARKLPFVGESIAEAIEKIVQTGKLQRLEATKDDPRNQVLALFMGIYGVGLSQATKWVAAGYTTLDDIREKAQLSGNQKLGLEHYNDLQLRIPRTEVEAHGSIFKSTVAGIDPDVEVTIGGSYRRGSDTSGDIDLIITKPGAALHEIRDIVLDQVVPELFSIGFLTAELARTSSENGSKWHGCSAIDDGPWRRIDFLLVPWDEMGAALIYFTGNDIFNRSIRLLASRKGMRLNQRGLYKDVMRGKGREKITEGELLESKSEKKIFEILGVPWRPPEHRNI